MAESAPIIHYEVYVRERTQWMLQVRFRADQKEQAINEAKLIEKTLGLGVKVVRETYYPDTNTCEEVTSYVSQKLTPQEASFSPLSTVNTVRPRQPRRAGGGLAGGGGPEAGARLLPRGEASGESILALLVKLLAIIVLSGGVAITCTAAVYSLLGRITLFGMVIAPQYYSRIIFATFVAVFLLVAVPLALIFVGGVRARRGQRKVKPPPPRPAAAKITRSAKAPQPDLVEDIETTVLVVQDSNRPQPPKGMLARMMSRMNALFGAKPVAQPAPREIYDVTIDQPEPTELSTAVSEPPPDWGLQTQVAEGPPPSEYLPPDYLSPEPPRLAEPVGFDRHRMTTMRFLGDLLGKLKSIRPTLDAYNRFGVDLMMAGAVETLAEQNTIPEHLSRQLLQECVELLGTKKLMAESFCAKVEEYLQEPRYLHLVQAGRDMMARFLAEAADPFGGLAAALELWNKPAAKPGGQQIVTVLFTDMVGSTDLTQAKGDMAAQEVVRRHNSIVRQALAEFDGREIKHTGDGIMASFASTANAVDAAVAIQRAVNAHNAGAPENPVHLRIGINAGEPIQEEDDLFGTTVQLAARICAKAEADQVVCSNVVRELSQGKGRRFASLGEHALKGFRDPVPLYEVVWLELSLDGEGE